MKFRYAKYAPSLIDAIDLEDLVARLSDLLMSSGFDSPHGDDATDRTMQALHDAIMEALFNEGMLPPDLIERLMGEPADGDQEALQRALEQLVSQIIERMTAEGFITPAPDLEGAEARRHQPGGGSGDDAGQVRFEVTDKSLDFLGYRALRDLLGSMGHGSTGRHDTRHQATGVETSGAPKPYEFGDTLNLDPSSTIMNAVQRIAGARAEGRLRENGDSPHFPGRPDEKWGQSPFSVQSPLSVVGAGFSRPTIDVEYEDLMVQQGEYQSSCATVIMLDCSHSMILYGEDRFTPAKRVALALSHLIRTQYPGDTLHAVLFHDSAEEVPITQLGRVRVGPYYTNTRAGLRLARRILERQRQDMRQIIMITDGKPSALTQPDGRVYKNAFGLDPFIVSETFAEVAACRKAGILINTFMLARDYDLVSFVRRVAAICHGKAYFTTPYTLGQYVLMDYLDKKTRTIH